VTVVLGLIDTLEKICKRRTVTAYQCKVNSKADGSLATCKVTITSFLKLYGRKAEL
jgi:hypothetical protein